MKLNSKLISERAYEIAAELAQKHAKAGWTINPNEKVVRGVINGIIRNSGDCPCVNDSQEKQCPCSGYRLNDRCCCGLYVKENENGK